MKLLASSLFECDVEIENIYRTGSKFKCLLCLRKDE